MLGETVSNRCLRQLEGLGRVLLVPFFERTRLQIPLRFVYKMPLVHARPVEHGNEPLEVRLALAEPRHLATGECLIEAMRGDGSRQRENFWHVETESMRDTRRGDSSRVLASGEGDAVHLLDGVSSAGWSGQTPRSEFLRAGSEGRRHEYCQSLTKFLSRRDL